MKDLMERIISIKAEIKELKYKRNEIHNQIQKKRGCIRRAGKING